MIDKIKNNQMLLSIIGVLALMMLLTGITYAAFSKTSSSGNNSISSGTISMSFQEPSNNVVITNAMPTSGYNGYSSTTHFDFSVSATAKKAMTIPYEITITEKSSNTLAASNVKIGLKRNGTTVIAFANGGQQASNLTASTTRSGTKRLLLDELSLAQSGSNYTATNNYQLFLWIKSDATIPNDGTTQQYSISINVDSYVQGMGVSNSTYVVSTQYMRIGNTIPSGVNQRNTAELAMADWIGFMGNTSTYPYCLKQSLNSNNEIEESYIVFKVTEDMVTANPGMVAGTYEIKGGYSGIAHAENINVIKTAFGYSSYPSRCSGSTSFTCTVSGLSVSTRNDGNIYANNLGDSGGNYCAVGNDNRSFCNREISF